LPNIEALTQLERIVRDAPDEQFHMRAVVEEASCGTARCAIGWCIIDPWFQQNTRLNELLPETYDMVSLSVFNPLTSDYYVSGDDTRLYSTAFLADIFGIGYEDCNNLFAGNLSLEANAHAVSKEEVLDNIGRLIYGQGARPYKATFLNAPTYAGGIENPYYEPDEPDSYELVEYRGEILALILAL
jgi:hypothetical protein